jgi:AcrR family transcriptional regulator
MTEPPYRRIVAEIRERITTGELRPGERVPSARQITQEFGVAIATATKVLATLRQDGLVRPVAGVGTVVAGTPIPMSPPNGSPQRIVTLDARADSDLNRDRIVRAAIAVADAEGLAGLSMRRVASELGVAAMSLYRHVPGKDELLLYMADAVYGDFPVPDRPATGWRAQMEQAARLQWEVYRVHPWAATVVSLSRPMLAPNGMAHTEWTIRALAEAGLDLQTAMYAAVTLQAFVMGLATHQQKEREAEQETGITSEEWFNEQDQTFHAIMASGRFPVLASFAADPNADLDLDMLFELGLGLLLDGMADFVDRHTPAPRSA